MQKCIYWWLSRLENSVCCSPMTSPTVPSLLVPEYSPKKRQKQKNCRAGYWSPRKQAFILHRGVSSQTQSTNIIKLFVSHPLQNKTLTLCILAHDHKRFQCQHSATGYLKHFPFWTSGQRNSKQTKARGWHVCNANTFIIAAKVNTNNSVLHWREDLSFVNVSWMAKGLRGLKTAAELRDSTRKIIPRISCGMEPREWCLNCESRL